MSLMLPPSSEAKDLDGKMACMSLSGYGKCARQTVDLDEILNSIKENLRLEQKQVMEMNYVTMHRLLSPIQARIYRLKNIINNAEERLCALMWGRKSLL